MPWLHAARRRQRAEAATAARRPLQPRCQPPLLSAPQPPNRLAPLAAPLSSCACISLQTGQRLYDKDLDFSYKPFLSILGTGLVTANGAHWQSQRLLMVGGGERASGRRAAGPA